VHPQTLHVLQVPFKQRVFAVVAQCFNHDEQSAHAYMEKTMTFSSNPNEVRMDIISPDKYFRFLEDIKVVVNFDIKARTWPSTSPA
jgi:hypothetical protein